MSPEAGATSASTSGCSPSASWPPSRSRRGARGCPPPPALPIALPVGRRAGRGRGRGRRLRAGQASDHVVPSRGRGRRVVAVPSATSRTSPSRWRWPSTTAATSPRSCGAASRPCPRSDRGGDELSEFQRLRFVILRRSASRCRRRSTSTAASSKTSRSASPSPYVATLSFRLIGSSGAGPQMVACDGLYLTFSLVVSMSCSTSSTAVCSWSMKVDVPASREVLTLAEPSTRPRPRSA